MEPDIAKILSYEIRKELADRYFGFRKLIEEDKQALGDQVRRYTITIEQQICLDLVRIYILLKDKILIDAFLEITGLDEEIYYDPYIVESPTIRQRVFQEIKARGFTQSSRFVNLLLDSYSSLVDHVERYGDKFWELLESQETIEEEIKLFYQKHDLGNIMGFLRSMETGSSASSVMDTGVGVGSSKELEKKMRLEPPQPISQLLPIIPPLVPLQRIKKPLKRLAKQAYRLQKQEA